MRLFALTPFIPLSRLAGEGERASGRTAVRPYTSRPQERAAGRTAVRPYTPRPQRGRGLTPAAEVEQHLQQVGVVDDAIPVEVFVAVAAPAEPV